MTRRQLLQFSLFASAAALVPRGVRAAAEGDIAPPEFAAVAAMLREKHVRTLPIGSAVGMCGRYFLDTPYVGGTLEINTDEKCVINFRGLDCVTFFELSLDLARIAIKNSVSYEALINEVTFTRYRGGTIVDYASRLHYTCDWFFDNEQKGVVRNITADLGGVVYQKKIDFMSTHPEKYRQLRENLVLVDKIRLAEDAIAKRKYFYIPKNQVAGIERKLQDGDIVGITTTIAGIDCSHTGLIIKDENRARFLHASSTKGKVIITDGSISEYLNSVAKHTGIMVVRPTPPS